MASPDLAPRPSPPPVSARRGRRALVRTLGFAGLLALVAIGLMVTGATAADPAPDYAIEVEAPTVGIGGEGHAVVRITALDPYKWNHEYPARVTVGDAALASVTVGKREFRQLSGDFEIGETVASVRIPVTGRAAGRETLTLDLRFSVCTDKVCLIKRASTEIAVTVTP